MSHTALVMVLVAAVLHASWNAIVKRAGDRAIAMAAVAAAHAVVGGVALAFVGPPAASSWPFIIASAIIHYAYYAFLFLSYRFGDLSHVYPIARGIAPMLVALGALVFAGETLVPKAWGGVITVSLGIGLLALRRNGAVAAERSAVLAALATGLMIASYSVVDGIGIRLSEVPAGYIAWIFFLEFPITLGILWHRRAMLAQRPGTAGRDRLFGRAAFGARLRPRPLCQDHRAARCRLGRAGIERHHRRPDRCRSLPRAALGTARRRRDDRGTRRDPARDGQAGRVMTSAGGKPVRSCPATKATPGRADACRLTRQGHALD